MKAFWVVLTRLSRLSYKRVEHPSLRGRTTKW